MWNIGNLSYQSLILVTELFAVRLVLTLDKIKFTNVIKIRYIKNIKPIHIDNLVQWFTIDEYECYWFCKTLNWISLYQRSIKY